MFLLRVPSCPSWIVSLIGPRRGFVIHYCILRRWRCSCRVLSGPWPGAGVPFSVSTLRRWGWRRDRSPSPVPIRVPRSRRCTGGRRRRAPGAKSGPGCPASRCLRSPGTGAANVGRVRHRAARRDAVTRHFSDVFLSGYGASAPNPTYPTSSHLAFKAIGRKEYTKLRRIFVRIQGAITGV